MHRRIVDEMQYASSLATHVVIEYFQILLEEIRVHPRFLEVHVDRPRRVQPLWVLLLRHCRVPPRRIGLLGLAVDALWSHSRSDEPQRAAVRAAGVHEEHGSDTYLVLFQGRGAATTD